MQRWMLWVLLGIVGLAVLLFGALLAKREYHARQPSRMWVPVTLRPDLSIEDQKKIAGIIDEKIRNEDILRKVVIDVGLKDKFKQPSVEAAVIELDRRLFVEAGTAQTPQGSVPSINVGVNGIGRESKILGDASLRIVRDVWRIIGIDPETGKPLPGAGRPASSATF